MAVLPHFSQSFARHRNTPFRARYIVLVILVLCIYFLFSPSDGDETYTRQQITDFPNPLHTVHNTEDDSFGGNSPLWHDKATAHGDVPSVADALEKQREDNLEAVSFLNAPPKEVVSPDALAQSGATNAVTESNVATSEDSIDTVHTGATNLMHEDLAEILRVHDSGDTIEQLETKPVDQALIDALDKAKAGASAAMEAAAEVVAPAVISGAPPLPGTGETEEVGGDPTEEEIAKPPPKSVFSEFNFMFAFGDSWSTTSFELTGPQPSPSNPLGNPQLPQNGVTPPPEWLTYLTTKYNSSYLRTYNIARGAATIDRNVVPPHPGFAFTWTFKEQATDAFGLTYSRPTNDISWGTADTLFAVWFGVVDIALLLERGKWDEGTNTRLMTTYTNTIESLYSFGARRFLILNCPPLARMPMAEHTDVSIPAVEDFNKRLKEVQKGYTAKHSNDIEAEMYLFDVHGLLAGIMDDPSITVQTQGLKNTTDNCWNYNPDANAPTQAWDRFDEECNVAYNEYFWANPLHPTYPVHEAIAAKVVSDCFDVKGQRTGFCM